MHYRSLIQTSILISSVLFFSCVSLSDCTNVTEKGEITESAPTEFSKLNYLLLGAPLLPLIQVAAIKAMGQPWISPSGQVDIWNGQTYGPENSQHFTDWYTLDHVLHGFIFYHLTGLLPWEDVHPRFFLALAVESIWEILENSPYIIRKYRTTALAQGYSGDSVINSVSDTAAMAVGFWIAHFLPTHATVALAVAEELLLAYNIRDNLLINIFTLLFPDNKVISAWQSELIIKP